MPEDFQDEIRGRLKVVYEELKAIEDFLGRKKVKFGIMRHLVVKAYEALERWQFRS